MLLGIKKYEKLMQKNLFGLSIFICRTGQSHLLVWVFALYWLAMAHEIGEDRLSSCKFIGA